MNTINPRLYELERSHIKAGSLAFYRANWKPSNKWIAWAGESPYCHVGMIYRSHGHLFLIDTRQRVGGQIYKLSDEVKKCSGEWDIYRIIDPNYDSYKAVKTMLGIIGKKYGWGALSRAMFMAMIRKIPFVKSHYQKIMPDTNGKSFPFCSMAGSWAVKGGHVDLCPSKADQFTEPGDLIQDKEKIVYQSTLLWEKEK